MNYFNKRKIIFTILSITLFVLPGLLLSSGNVYGQNFNLFLQEEELDSEYLDKLNQVIAMIDAYYVEEKSTEELIENAIQGMVGNLDEYSHYLTEQEFEEQQFQMEGEYGGIGLRVLTIDEELTIVAPIPGTPGERAGLQSGDIILEVNGKPTSEMSQERAVDLMRGEEGTSVELLIGREDKDPFSVEIIRERIEIPYVTGEMETDRIGYISITQFMDEVGLKLENKIKELDDEGAEALILDLRNNPGGLLPEAINSASNFIEEGELLTVKSRMGEESWYASDDIQSVDLPLVVLINKGSASGSEIVAGALQDYERAKLVGTTTFGKGSVQTLLPLDDGTAIKLTTANFYLPSGVNIYEQGVNPDVKVELDVPEEDEIIPEENDVEDKQLQKAVEILEQEYLK